MSEGRKRTISIALLVTDTPPESITSTRGDYTRIYPEFLFNSLNSIKRHGWQDPIELQIRPYDVRHKMEYPDQGQLGDGLWDALMITGSAASAYAEDEWAGKLAAFLRDTAARHPLVRIIGICYGHQIVSRAFGALVVPNPRGWEWGTTHCLLNADGHHLLGYDDAEPFFAIQQVHKDEVADLPPPFQATPFLNLASTHVSKIQALALPYPTEAPPLPSAAATSAYMAFDISDSATASSGPHPLRSLHILTFQGHPEFDQDIVSKIVDARTEKGIVSPELNAIAKSNAALPHHGIRIGRAILSMLGVEPARTESGDEMVNL